jgi:NAD(P)H-nitrite reductase large subunit
VTGKLVYELSWAKNSKPGSYITYEQVLNAKSSSAGKELVLAPQIKTEKEKKYVKKEEEDCAGICSCFAVRKKKTETPRRI